MAGDGGKRKLGKPARHSNNTKLRRTRHKKNRANGAARRTSLEEGYP